MAPWVSEDGWKRCKGPKRKLQVEWRNTGSAMQVENARSPHSVLDPTSGGDGGSSRRWREAEVDSGAVVEHEFIIRGCPI